MFTRIVIEAGVEILTVWRSNTGSNGKSPLGNAATVVKVSKNDEIGNFLMPFKSLKSWLKSFVVVIKLSSSLAIFVDIFLIGNLVEMLLPTPFDGNSGISGIIGTAILFDFVSVLFGELLQVFVSWSYSKQRHK